MTSNEIDTTAAGEVAAPGATLSGDATAQLMGHATAMQAAHELAVKMCASDLVPAIYKGKPDNGAAAILYGAELGLTPIQSMQQIFVVHNTPAIYARTMVALVTARGHEVWEAESSPEQVTVCGRRRGSDVVTQSTWTLERARKAGYTSNKKYDTDPQAMLYAKAATEVCRKMAPDVLLGIAYSREELEMEPRRVVSERVPARGTAGVRERLGIDAAQPAESPVPVLASADERRDLVALLESVGLGEPADALGFISEALGRPVASTGDLTSDEVAQVSDAVADRTEGGR